eukprot:gene9913-10964_t
MSDPHDTISLPVRLPDGSIFYAKVAGLAFLLVSDLKLLLYRQGVPIRPDRMKLVHQHRCLSEVESLDGTIVTEENPLYLILRVIEDQPLLVSYDDFLLSSYPKHSVINVSVNVEIRIVLQANAMDHMVFTPSLAHSSEMETLLPITNRALTVKERWTDATFYERVLLLQVDDSFEVKWENLRYDMSRRRPIEANPDSWQRYTRHLPIPCELSIPSIVDPLPHEVRLRPCQPLHHNTHYAVLLCHNVPTIPLRGRNEDWRFFSAGIGQDKVIIFRTEKSPFDRPRNTLRTFATTNIASGSAGGGVEGGRGSFVASLG